MINSFTKDGFLVVKDFLSASKTQQCLELIKTSIDKAADDLGVDGTAYLGCTGRWGTKSPITRNVSSMLDNQIKKYLESLLQSKLIYKKSNVICKTCAITDPIPFHQDISYSAGDPYHFSLWLSLNDVKIDSAPLQILENSHKKKVEPAVDFWDPYFVDQYNVGSMNARSITVNAGDAIMFSSRLWHGSGKNHSHKDRFAYVTRWIIDGEGFPEIPAIQEASFGMFNCGRLTGQILERSLTLPDIKQQEKIESRDEVIMLWIDILTKNPNIWGINGAIAIRDLEKLRILNKACDFHDAGNISGLVYKNLWHSLLSVLNSKIALVDI